MSLDPIMCFRKCCSVVCVCQVALKKEALGNIQKWCYLNNRWNCILRNKLERFYTKDVQVKPGFFGGATNYSTIKVERFLSISVPEP